MRAVLTLEEVGYSALVVASQTASNQGRDGSLHGLTVQRVSPSALVRWAERQFKGARGTTGERSSGPAGPRAGRARAASIAVRAFRWIRTMDFYVGGIRLVLRQRPVLVHCNDHNTMWIGVAAKLLGGSRVLYDAHELWPDRNGRWEWRPWLLATEALFTRIADEVVVASPGFVKPMTRRYRIAEPAVVRNVPAQARPTSIPQPPESDHVAVYVGALLLGRGLEQAIDAVALVPDLRLRVIGHGGADSTVDALLSRARAVGISDRLEILPPVPPDQVVASLAGASVGLSLFQPVCLSHELTLPNKLFEYVAAGVPILSSDMALSAEFVRRHGVGEVVPASDPVAIARGIVRLLAPDRAPALRRNLAATAREYNWERERSSLIAAYRSAVG